MKVYAVVESHDSGYECRECIELVYATELAAVTKALELIEQVKYAGTEYSVRVFEVQS